MKKLLTILSVLACSLYATAQSNLYAPPWCITAAAPTFNPGPKGCKVVLDTSTQTVYLWKVGTTWVAIGDGIDHVIGCSAPLYTPTKWQSNAAYNDCNPRQFFIYQGAGVWDQVGGATYTAGTGINIDGSNVISNTGDLSATNELITDFEVTGGSLVVTDAGGGHSVAVADIAPVQSLVGGTGISISGGGSAKTVTNSAPFTDEAAQDAVGAMAGQTLTYVDATPLLNVKTQMSVTSDASGVKLSGDATTPGNSKLYGTDGSGVKGWYAQPSGGGGTVTTNGTLDGDGSGGDPLKIAQQLAAESEVLMWTGATWEPSWGNPYTFVTSGATITTAINEILIGTISANITMGLPTCDATTNGKHFKFLRNGTDGFSVTFDPAGAQQFYPAMAMITQIGSIAIDCTCGLVGGSYFWFFDNL